MEKKTIRTGIIGAGFAATFHFECLKKVHDINVSKTVRHKKEI